MFSWGGSNLPRARYLHPKTGGGEQSCPKTAELPGPSLPRAALPVSCPGWGQDTPGFPSLEASCRGSFTPGWKAAQEKDKQVHLHSISRMKLSQNYLFLPKLEHWSRLSDLAYISAPLSIQP